MDLYEKIEKLFPKLSPALKKLAIYLKENWEQVCLMTAKEFGEKIGVSEASVHRLAAQLGYESFLNMKKDLRENYLKSRALVKFEQSDGLDKYDKWIKEHFNKEAYIIEKTSEMNPGRSFDEAAEIILSSERIWVAGWKLGITITSNIRFVLNYMLGNCYMVDKAECSELVSQIRKGDTLIVSGFQRYSLTTLKLVDAVKVRGAKIIVFTDSKLSPFAKYGDVNFFADTNSTYFLDSYTAALSIVNALIKRIALTNSDKIKRKIKDTEEMYKIFGKVFEWE